MMFQCVNIKTGVGVNPPTPFLNKGEEEDREEENMLERNCISAVRQQRINILITVLP